MIITLYVQLLMWQVGVMCNAIASIRPSVLPLISSLIFVTDCPLTLHVSIGHDHYSQRIEGQVHRSLARLWTHMWSR